MAPVAVDRPANSAAAVDVSLSFRNVGETFALNRQIWCLNGVTSVVKREAHRRSTSHHPDRRRQGFSSGHVLVFGAKYWELIKQNIIIRGYLDMARVFTVVMSSLSP